MLLFVCVRMRVRLLLGLCNYVRAVCVYASAFGSVFLCNCVCVRVSARVLLFLYMCLWYSGLNIHLWAKTLLL